MNYPKKSQQLIKFLQSKAKNNIQLKSFNNSKNNNHYCTSLDAQFNKNIISGFGQSKNKDEAVFIALMELTERYIFQTFSITSYSTYRKFGFGCHKSLRTSIQKASSEFYPRLDLFENQATSGVPLITDNQNVSFHWEQDTPWTDLFFEKSKDITKIPSIDSHINKNDFKIGHLNLCEDLNKIGVIAQVADSDALQSLFSNEWNANKINKNAITTNFLPPEMHMIG